MSRSLALDTHALIWFLEGNPKLPQTVRELMSDAATQWQLPVIVVAEALRLIRKGKTPVTESELRSMVAGNPRLTVVPLSLEMVLRSSAFASLDGIHDQLIVATVAVLNDSGADVTLATSDGVIHESKLVPTIWG